MNLTGTPDFGHERYMQRCLELARQGDGLTRPNPMVGSVIVANDRIIGEGYHVAAGTPHAEVVAINSVVDHGLLAESTLYVNLEPCSHHGKTPPCAGLIIQKRIPRVVIGCLDPFREVSGKGYRMLQRAGIDVTVGVLEKESRQLNSKFITFHEKGRPRVLLKWAQSMDGYIDIKRVLPAPNRPTWITNEHARRAVHLWRGREDAILVGSITALIDNPLLTVRDWVGANPTRVVIDRGNKLPGHLAMFNEEAPAIYFSGPAHPGMEGVKTIPVPYNANPVSFILGKLWQTGVQSLMVEGGAVLLNEFIKLGTWDEARVFTGNCWFGGGVKAPRIAAIPARQEKFGSSHLAVYYNFA